MCDTKEEIESNVAGLRQREGDSRGGKAAEQEQEQPWPGQKLQLPAAPGRRGRGRGAAAFPVLFLAFLVQVTVRKART